MVLINILSAKWLMEDVYFDVQDAALAQYERHLNLLADEGDVQIQNRDALSVATSLQSLPELAEVPFLSVPLDELTDDPFLYEQLSLLPINQLFVDAQTASIYVMQNNSQVLIVGPVIYHSFLSWFADWFLWLMACLVNGLGLSVLLMAMYRAHVNVRTQLAAVLPADIKKAQSTSAQLTELHGYLATNEQQSTEQLNLQRDLLHGVAHEFRSPMARIQFALDMLEDADLNTQVELKNTMQTALVGLDELVKELLYYAKLKDGSTAMQWQLISCQELLQDAIAQVAGFYPSVTYRISCDGDTVIADYNLLRRALINIMRNAGRFAQQQCLISVRTKEGQTCFYIEDDGIGIPPGKRVRIFEPFTRLDPSRSRDSGGCGLGLAIAQSVAQLHDGNITVIDGLADLGGACFCLNIKTHKNQPSD
ncbi:ATP-binding protein [Pseudoalteromonas sp. SMS1]|uniref:sensor histidine kinase n=1 Tax=Pseudoalteromonas sp. SMS1 TaxID=2908894 RepID=UPI001F47A3C6|nr:ATP-binding protein [Pseudoalteromonas sp. SMS1]MCF2859758.1 ATP-binding protein [Pseudoalteromonas sp. SMS1]